MATGILKKKLPPNMKSPLWEDFLDVIEEESEIVKNHMREKKYLYDIDNMSYDRMLEIAALLNIPFDVSVIGTEDFLRSEIKSIPFRIKYKATTKLYLSFFQALYRTGFIYLYYWNGSSLIRHAENMLYDVNDVDPTLPYKLRSKMQFGEFISEALTLDSGLQLDTSWFLDNKSSKTNTNHLCLEFFLDQYIYGDELGLAPSNELAPSETLAPITRIKYLIRPNYFSYLRTNLEISKKATEVLHIGAQLNIITDNSHYYDSKGLEFTVPSIYTNFCTTNFMDDITSVSDIKYIAYGISQDGNLPSLVKGSGVQPTTLKEKIAKVEINLEEKWENDEWYAVNGTYIGNLINDLLIATGDGSTSSFTYSLPYYPVKPGNVKISYTSGLIERFIEDDFHGNLSGAQGTGTIDYSTGEIDFSTIFYSDETELLGTGNGATTHFEHTLDANNVPVGPSTFSVQYIITGTLLVATDNGTGTITGNGCSGTINYTNGSIVLNFSQAPANTTEIKAYFRKQISYVPDLDTPITVEYYFIGGETEISELGLLDADNNLLAYAEFPKVNFDSFYNHLNTGLIIKKTAFS